jgi:Histidine kinase
MPANYASSDNIFFTIRQFTTTVLNSTEQGYCITFSKCSPWLNLFYMRTRFFILFFLVIINATAQTYRIDSLKKMLPGQSGHALVNCLNTLGWEFIFHSIHSDSALKYANLAYHQASAINYNSGKAVSLIIQAEVQGRLLGYPKLMKSNSQQAIDLLKNENDPKNLSTAYYYLSLAYAFQGTYDSALAAAGKARQIAIEANDKSRLAWAIQATGYIYCQSGDYWKGFENLIESQQMGKELNDSLLTSVSLAFIARSFNRAGDPQKALNYYHQSLQYATPFLLLWPHLEDMAYAHLQLKQYDSVLYYQQKHRHNLDSLTKDILVRKKFSAFLWGYSIDVQIARKEYDKALADLLPQVDQLRNNRDVAPFMQSLLAIGKVYEGKKNYPASFRYTRELFQVARQTDNKQFLKEANQLMASLFDQLKKSDSAYIYFRQFTAIKDSMEITQFAQRTALYLSAYEAENKIRLFKKDKEINEKQLALNKKELQKQSQLKKILVLSLFVMFLISLLVIRNIILKRKNEKLQNEQSQSEMKRNALELEMQALRAQMNPHFIFNCLSAIDNLIQTSQADKATSYLARFAKLIRGVLDSSKNNVVPFQKDFETLQLYLEMEQFRCNNKFSYSLTADQELQHGDYKVPPLIIQPFIENAIHHGLLNKQDGNRQLEVTAQLKDEQIIYSITDNGIGRKRAAELKEINRPGQESYGIDITRERIHLHNKNGKANDVEIADLEVGGMAAGTKAIIRINNFET